MSTLPNGPRELGKDFKFKIATPFSYEKGKKAPEEYAAIVPDDAYYFEGYANKTTVDRYLDLIVPEFWSDETIGEYMINPVLLSNHNRDISIGKILHAEGRDDGLFVKGYVSGKWQYSWQLGDDTIRSLSVWVYIDDAIWDEQAGHYKLLSGSLLEISLATIPANKESVFAVSKCLDADQYDDFVKRFPKSKTMEKVDFKKWLAKAAPMFKKFGVDLTGEETPEAVQKALDEAEGLEGLKKSLTTDITAAVIAEMAKTAPGAPAAPGTGDDPNNPGESGKTTPAAETSEAIKTMQAKLDEMDKSRKSLEQEIATLKGEKTVEPPANSGQPPAPTVEENFMKNLSSTKVKGKAKYA